MFLTNPCFVAILLQRWWYHHTGTHELLQIAQDRYPSIWVQRIDTPALLQIAQIAQNIPTGAEDRKHFYCLSDTRKTSFRLKHNRLPGIRKTSKKIKNAQLRVQRRGLGREWYIRIESVINTYKSPHEPTNEKQYTRNESIGWGLGVL